MEANILNEKTWNFHNYIAIPLEKDAERISDNADMKKMFNADAIECGKFAEAMITMLRLYTHYQSNSEVDAFVKMCSGYMGRNALEIPAEEAKALYKEYNDLRSVLRR